MSSPLARTGQLWTELQQARQDVVEIRRQFLEALVTARDAGLSQAAIGDWLGISQQRIAQLESVARDRRMTSWT